MHEKVNASIFTRPDLVNLKYDPSSMLIILEKVFLGSCKDHGDLRFYKNAREKCMRN